MRTWPRACIRKKTLLNVYVYLDDKFDKFFCILIPFAPSYNLAITSEKYKIGNQEHLYKNLKREKNYGNQNRILKITFYCTLKKQ